MELNAKVSYWKLFLRIARFPLFWLLLAMLDRIVFLLVFSSKYTGIAFQQFFLACLNGFKMDLSMAAYLSLLPFIVIVIRLLIPRLYVPPVFLKIYTGIFIVLYLAVSMANLFLYMEWSEKISLKAVDLFVSSPREALASLPLYQLLLLLLAVILLTWALLRFADKVVGYTQPLPLPRANKFYSRLYSGSLIRHMVSLFFVLLGSFLLFTCIRGGYGRAPMNPSMVYFSSVPFLNHAATNTHWYLLDDVLKHKNTRHPFLYMEPEQASALVDHLLDRKSENLNTEADSVPVVLVRGMPLNVVTIILEGFTASVVKSLGGEADVSPGLEKIMNEGLLFDRIYSVAERSDKGMVGLLSAFPAQGPQSVIRSVGKLEKLPSIAEEFQRAGYGTSFYYGGQSEFYNLKSYVLMNGYDHLSDLESFDDVSHKSSWGIYDETLFDKHLQDLGRMKEPFFSTVYTLTNHHPFELPGTYRFGRNGMDNQFRSTAFYTDSVLYDYLAKAKNTSWYANTLFVIVADHGHRLPDDRWDIYQYQRHHIPLLLFGSVLKEEYRGTRISKIGSQVDLAKTLLHQIGLPADRYPWSKNLLDHNRQGFAFYNWQTGFGLLTEDGAISYDFVGNHLIFSDPEEMSESIQSDLLKKAKAIMQQVYTEYLDY